MAAMDFAPKIKMQSSLHQAHWQRFAGYFISAVVLLIAFFLTVAYLLDPYGSGRSPIRFIEGVRPQGHRTAAASRGRDRSFNAAVFGNSHMQLLSPDRLKSDAGLAFVSLIAPASGPREQLTLIGWFLRHRAEEAQAIVIGVDHLWCGSDPNLPNNKPFPFWLFSADLLEYFVGLLRFNVLEELPRRVGFILSKNPDRARADGYFDYEDGYLMMGYISDPNLRSALEKPNGISGGNLSGTFPAAKQLEDLLSRYSPDLKVILVRPPGYKSTIAAPGSFHDLANKACRSAFASLAERRPQTVLIDWRVDREEIRNPNEFFDHTHYRQGIARLIEKDIAIAVRQLSKPDN